MFGSAGDRPGLLALVLACVVSLSPVDAAAILQRSGEQMLDVGAFRLFVTNLGVLGNATYPSFSDKPSLEWPAGSGNEFLLEAGLWIGARDRAGHLIGVSTSAPTSEFRPLLDPVDRIYESFDGAQGTRRLGQVDRVLRADDDQDGQIEEEFHNGKDDDGDGLIDEDYTALGSQQLSFEFRDDTSQAVDQLLAHRPLHLAVRQSVSTWSEGIDGLERCAVVRLQVTNDGQETLYDLRLGVYVDPDIGPKSRDGYWQDDRYRIETVSGAFTARGENIIQGCESEFFERTVVIVEDEPDSLRGRGGDAPGLLAAMILDHSLHRWGHRRPEVVGPTGIAHLPARAGANHRTEEISDTEKYLILERDGHEGNARVADHRFIMTCGPFTELLPGETLDLSYALVLSLDHEELVETVTTLVSHFRGQWMDLDGLLRTGPVGRETCLTIADAVFCNFTPFLVDDDCDEPASRELGHVGCRSSRIQSYCPGQYLDRCSARLQITTAACRYVDFDCDRCSPNVHGAETLVRWSETAALLSPRPIAKQVTPGDGQVTVEWNNAAEAPVAYGSLPRIDGYRVWRVDGWDSPPGSGGPGGDQWALVAELVLPGSGSPGTPLEIDEGTGIIDHVPVLGDSLYPIYAVGRYRYIDDSVRNGFATFYDVTPFTIESAVGEVLTTIDLRPRAESSEVVFAREAVDSSPVIRVVPNPYVLSAGWDLQPNRAQPSGRKIIFRGLPGRRARIRIYSLAGDLVRVIEHDGLSGAADWDLMNRNQQPVVSGIYLYHVEATALSHLGKLVIVK